MIHRAALSRAEKKIISKIINIQLDSLRSMLSRDIPQDLTTYCLINNIDEIQFWDQVRICQSKFRVLQYAPEGIFNMDYDNLQTIRTILVNIASDKYAEGKKQLFHKFTIIDKLEEYHSLN